MLGKNYAPLYLPNVISHKKSTTKLYILTDSGLI